MELKLKVSINASILREALKNILMSTNVEIRLQQTNLCINQGLPPGLVPLLEGDHVEDVPVQGAGRVSAAQAHVATHRHMLVPESSPPE